MGYALFTARKLMLTNRVNMLNYRLMVLSQRKMTVSNQSSTLQSLFSQQSQMAQMRQQRMMSQMTFGMMTASTKYANDPTALQKEQAKMQEAYNNTLQPFMLQAYEQDMVNNNVLQGVQMGENAIDLEMKSIETQLKAAQSELENIDKAEDKAIKDSAPKYG